MTPLIVIFEYTLQLFLVFSIVDFEQVDVSWVTNVSEPCPTRQTPVSENCVNYFFLWICAN